MFATHQPVIARYGQSGPAPMARVITLAVVTARWPFIRVPEAMRAIDVGDANASSGVFGWKYEAIRLLHQHKDANYHQLMDLWEHRDTDPQAAREIVAYLTGLHGLGLAKAGFAAQMLFGVSGCLDTHNLLRFGYAPRHFERIRPGMRRVTRLRWIDEYHGAVDARGGTQRLWDGWCVWLARTYPQDYSSPEMVSGLHTEALGL